MISANQTVFIAPLYTSKIDFRLEDVEALSAFVDNIPSTLNLRTRDRESRTDKNELPFKKHLELC